MTVKFRPLFAYGVIIFSLLMFYNPIAVRANISFQRKVLSGERLLMIVSEEQGEEGVGTLFNKPVISSLKGVILQSEPTKYLLLTKWELFAMAILITSILGWGYNEYRKKNALSSKLSVLSIEMADQDICLQDITKEKEWLVEELHHRVKNNLQVVVSLLDSQSAYLTHPEALQAVKSSQHRMYAISLVHQKLYQTDSLSIINMVAYINDLLQYLQDEYQSNNRIRVIVKTVPLSLSLTAAIPLGLIINEAVSNILQYAFPKQTQGEIKLTLSKDGQENYLLCIADNGIGLPPEFNIKAPTSLGTILMTGLSQQIHADLEIKNTNGVLITLRFRYIASQTYPLSA